MKPSKSKPQPAPKRTNLYLALALAVLSFVVFANSIGNDYNLDDELVTNHQRLTSKGISAIPEIFSSSYFDNQAGSNYEYRPVTLATFAIENTLLGESPGGSHFINVLLHAITVMLLYLTLRSVLPGDNFLVALVATLLFAVHPLHTEVVASIKNRDEILCFMGGILAWRYADKFVKWERIHWLSYLLFILFFVFGILSKRSILSYTIVIPLAILWFNDAKPLKLLLVSLPLAFGFYLLSPAANNTLSLAVAAFMVLAPFVVRAIFYGNFTIGNPIGHLLMNQNAPKSSSEKEQYEVVNWRSMIAPANWSWLGLYSVASGVMVFSILHNIRWLILGDLTLLVLASILSPKPLRAILSMVSIGFMTFAAYNFNLPMLARFDILLLGVFFFLGGRKQRILVGSIMLLLAIGYIIRWNGMVVTPVVEMLVLLGVLGFFTFMKEKIWALVPLVLYVADMVSGITHKHSDLFPIAFPLLICVVYLLLWFKPVRSYAVTVSLLIGVAIFGIQQSRPNVYNQVYITVNAVDAAPKQISLVAPTYLVPSAGRILDNAENPLIIASWTEKSATAVMVISKYIQLLVLPITFRFYYGYNQFAVANWSQPLPWLLLMFIIGLLIAALWFRKRYPVITLGVFSLLLGLFFISNMPVLVAGVVAERLAFVASLGFCLAVTGALQLLLIGQPVSSVLDLKKQPIVLAVLAVLVIGCSIRTIDRNTNWKDRLTLYSHDIIDLPNSAKAQQLMGVEYLQLAGKTKDATKQAKLLEQSKGFLARSIEIAPSFHSPVYNMAYLYLVKQDCDSAIVWMRRSLQMEPNMSAGMFYNNMARCYEVKNQLDSAAENYAKAIAETPNVLDYYSRINYAYHRLGKNKEVIEYDLKAIKQFPYEFDLYIDAAQTYLTLNDNAAALGMFEGAYRLRPNDLALVKMLIDLSNRTGNKEKAARYAQVANNIGAK